jgi:hypothetical protein
MTDADLITLAEREISSLPPASAAIMRALVERVKVKVPSNWVVGGTAPSASPTITGGGYVPTSTTVWRSGYPIGHERADQQAWRRA